MAKPTSVTNRITELRSTHGMSQAELGQRIGVTRQTVNAIERGKYSPSLEVAFKIARTLGAPLESIFDYPDEPRTTDANQRSEPPQKQSINESILSHLHLEQLVSTDPESNSPREQRP